MPFGSVEWGRTAEELSVCHADLNWVGTSLAAFCAGVEVFHSEDPSQPAGMIVLAAANPFENDRIDLQVECKLEPLETGELRVANPKGPALKLDALPYPLIEI